MIYEIIKINCKCTIKNGIVFWGFKNNLEKGLYTLIKIEEVNNLFFIGDGINEKLFGAFKVNGNSKNSIEAYNKIVNMRRINFNKCNLAGNLCDFTNGDTGIR